MRALEHAYERCVGGQTDPLALWRSHRGGTIEALGQRLVGNDYRRFVTVYREYYYTHNRQVPVFDGVAEVLGALHAHGVPMAVVTSKISWGATDELQSAGLLQYFAAVVGVDDTEHHKPDPEPIFTALERLLVDDPEPVAFIGDSPADVFAARNAGCVSIAAHWGTLDAELLQDATPTFRADAPRDVLGLLAMERRHAV
jgi:pyrophosphatase PpaX